MRILNMLYGGLVGVAVGMVLVSLSGELLGLTLLGLVLMLFGLIIGAREGWRRPEWLNTGGVLGGLMGIVPGIVMLLVDGEARIVLNDPLVILRWNEVVTIVLAVGFPLGLFLGNRLWRPQQPPVVRS